MSRSLVESAQRMARTVESGTRGRFGAWRAEKVQANCLPATLSERRPSRSISAVASGRARARRRASSRVGMGGVIALGEAAGKARLLAGLEDAAGIAFTTEDTA